ncbi:hypothetical protein MATL_G00242020 [Megalops atlanticus]|uniref:Uncharacterized protein n=1 Tax=Megalops atlanticus TaxID=7932 RepID=A0A9D3PCI0_MEGAT|nr:hypothetical protein MATL_G00242020 [Megalops atlanticus]
MTKCPSDHGYWRFSSSSCVDQQSSRSSRASGWACKMATSSVPTRPPPFSQSNVIPAFLAPMVTPGLAKLNTCLRLPVLLYRLFGFIFDLASPSCVPVWSFLPCALNRNKFML